MLTEYKKLLDNPNYRIIISGLKGKPVTAVLQNEFAVAGGNDFTTAGEVARELPIAGKILAIKDKFAAAAKTTGRSTLTQLETRLVWNNSLKPNFTVEMFFYQESIFDSDLIQDQYLRLKSASLPTKQGKNFFRAPRRYNPLAGTGTLSLQIGSWFRATKLLLINESFSFSKEVAPNGRPLFIVGSITLEPHQGLTLKEYEDYFIG